MSEELGEGLKGGYQPCGHEREFIYDYVDEKIAVLEGETVQIHEQSFIDYSNVHIKWDDGSHLCICLGAEMDEHGYVTSDKAGELAGPMLSELGRKIQKGTIAEWEDTNGA